MSAQLNQLVQALRGHDWSVKVDKPVDPTGTWWVDVDADGQPFVIAWHDEHGFGLSSPDPDAFGEGHDEEFDSAERLVGRLEQLVEAQQVTQPPRAVALSRIRELLAFTQEEIARELQIQQAAVSKLERRDDMHVSTLSRLIEAMGGNLKLIAKFDNDVMEVELPSAHGDYQKPTTATPCRHVIPHERGWAVKKAGGKKASSVHKTQKEAIQAARQLLQKRGGGKLAVHGQDGRLRRSSTVGSEGSSRHAGTPR